MNETLQALLRAAVEDAALRAALKATEQAADPMLALCKVAAEAGFPLELADLFAESEEYSDNMLKSTNGGATYPFDYLDDIVSIFYAALK